MARYVGLADDLEIGKQLVDKDTESTYATHFESYLDISAIEWTVNNQITPRGSVGGGVNFQRMVPGVALVTGRLDARVCDVKAFELPFGDLADPGAADDYDITVTDALDYYSMQAMLTDTKMASIVGAKFHTINFKCAIGSPVEISMDFAALHFATSVDTPGGTRPTKDPFEYYHGCVKWDSVTTDIINDLSVTQTRNSEARRGIECVTIGDLREATEVIDKMLGVSGDLSVVVVDDTWVTDALGGTSIADELTEVDCELVFARSATEDFTWTLTNCTIEEITGSNLEEVEERIFSVRFQCRDSAIVGNVA